MSFTGTGLTSSRARAEGLAPDTGSSSWAQSAYNVSFAISAATRFSYTARYFGKGDGLFPALVGRLEPEYGLPVFLDEFRFFPNLDEMRMHTGLLAPGRYSLILVSDAGYVTAPGESFRDGAFGFTFAFEPANPIPEPTTILLVGGAAGLLIRSRCRRRSRNE